MIKKMAGVCKSGESSGHNPGEEPSPLTRCYSCGLSQLYEAHGGGGLSVVKLSFFLLVFNSCLYFL